MKRQSEYLLAPLSVSERIFVVRDATAGECWFIEGGPRECTLRPP